MGEARAAARHSLNGHRVPRLRRMNTTELLANIRDASPCSARWADMAGDARARFCVQCSKHVYNLSAMTAEGAANLIQEKEGNLCVRFYRRKDDTVLTADCPVGAAAVVRRVKRLVAVGIGVLVPAFAAPLWYSPQSSRGTNRSAIYQTWDKTLVAIKNWINPPPPAPPLPPAPIPNPGAFAIGEMMMGKLCPTPPLPANSRPPLPPSPL